MTPKLTGVDVVGSSSEFGDVQSLELGSGSVDVRPFHSVVRGRKHCFQVTTEAGSKYFACKNESQRHEWIEKLVSAIFLLSLLPLVA